MYQGLIALRDYSSYLFMNCQYQSRLLPYPLNGMRIRRYFVIEKLFYLWEKWELMKEFRILSLTVGKERKIVKPK